MVSGREWRRRLAAGFWRHAAPRAASACQRNRISRVASPATKTCIASKLESLKLRREFVRVAAGRKAAAPGLVLQAAPQPETPTRIARVRVGFTASRKVGNSVTRNRAKRRMRAAAARVLPNQGKPGTDYVLIARASTADRPFSALVADLAGALRRIESGNA